jgi:hypothetical protein
MQHLRWGKKHVRRVNGVRKTFKDPINPQVKPSSFPSLQETGKWYTILHSVVKFLGDRIKVGQLNNGRNPYRIPAFVTGFVEYFLSKSYRLVFGVDTNGFSISLRCYRWKGLSQNEWNKINGIPTTRSRTIPYFVGRWTPPDQCNTLFARLDATAPEDAYDLVISGDPGHNTNWRFLSI